MSPTSLLSMILILGIVVGGFAYFLSLAVRYEKKKKKTNGQN